MNAAQPFMLMVVQMGSTKRETFFDTLSQSSAVCIVTGSVAAELLVKSAISTAGIILPKMRIGFKPLIMRNNGRMIKNWMILPPRMTATYLPSEDITMPAENWAESWAAKDTMPRGNAQMRLWMSIKSRSCKPKRPFNTTLNLY